MVKWGNYNVVIFYKLLFSAMSKAESFWAFNIIGSFIPFFMQFWHTQIDCEYFKILAMGRNYQMPFFKFQNIYL